MKKKIKLVISDLRLGLGRSLEDGTKNSLEEFMFDEKFSEFIDFYMDKKYADCNIELILNGDILNFLHVSYKGHNLTVITESISIEKTKNIVKGHPIFFNALKKFASKEGRSITYIVGDHDQDVLWPGVQKYLNSTLDTYVNYRKMMYHFDGVHIEHGHMHEAINKFNSRKFFLKKNLAEPILNLSFGAHFSLDFLLDIKRKYPYIDRIKPFSKMLRWSLFNETLFTIKSSFRLLFYFLKALLLKDKKKNFSLSGILRLIFKSARFLDLENLAEKILKDDRVSTVVFGHTHVYRHRQFADKKEYFNTGTWVELTSLDIASLGRITKLTYVLFEYNEENGKPLGRLKEWRGYHRVEEDVSI